MCPSWLVSGVHRCWALRVCGAVTDTHRTAKQVWLAVAVRLQCSSRLKQQLLTEAAALLFLTHPHVVVSAAVVSPVSGPNTTNTTSSAYILTTEPQGPPVLLPAGATNTSNVTAPYAVLQPNCSLMTYTAPGTKLVYATPVGQPAPVGPCRCGDGDGCTSRVDE